MRKTAIVDYGAGNIGSVSRAFAHLGAEPFLAKSAADLEGAEAIVLPGVGSFSCAKNIEPIRGALLSQMQKKPFLGICLGMQLLFESSEEAGGRGLGIYGGRVQRLKCKKVPHVGWNTLQAQGKSRLLAGVEGQAFYFCHSYAVKESDMILSAAASGTCGSTVQCNDAAAKTEVYGIGFVSAIERGNLFAVQFHPEKSGEAGLRVLKNFLKVVGE